MPSIHDSLLTGYVVDGKGRSITLHTEPHAGGGEAFIDVIFRGVVAYHFEHDCLENIVFGIEEVSADAIVGDGVAFAERNRYGWRADGTRESRQPSGSSTVAESASFDSNAATESTDGSPRSRWNNGPLLLRTHPTYGIETRASLPRRALF